MGRPPETEVRPGSAVAIATGAPLPPGADAVLKVEHTQAATPELLEVLRPVTPGEGMVRADEDAAAGAELARAGRPLRAAGPGDAGGRRHHRAPGVRAPARGDRLDGRRARAAGTSPAPEPGQVRDSSAPALAALVREAGGEPHFARHRARRPRAALAASAASGSTRLTGGATSSWSSAGSSVGARDETAAAIASLGEPGIWCHGLALSPGKPTLLADIGGVPVIGLPGNPRSALVVFRLIGMPIVRMVGGCTDPPPEPTVRARLARDLPSAAGRLDVVQVRLTATTPSRSSAAPRCCRSSRRRTATSSCPRPPPGSPPAAR